MQAVPQGTPRPHLFCQRSVERRKSALRRHTHWRGSDASHRRSNKWQSSPAPAGTIAAPQSGSLNRAAPVEVTTLLTYAAAHAAVTLAPGPILAVIITRTLTQDLGGAAGFTAGVCLGKIVAILAIAVGLGVWAKDSTQWLKLFQVSGSVYLLWLAARMWQSVHLGPSPKCPRRGWIGATTAGIAFSLCSPFTFLFYMMVLPSVIPRGLNDPYTLAVVIIVTVAVVGGLLSTVMLLARRFRRVLSSPGASIAFSRGMAVLLAATSIALVVS
jgi:threonine/homoserine/homoserine lactone efflux protein